MRGEDKQRKTSKTKVAAGRRSTRFIAARRTARQVVTGEEPGKADGAQLKEADSLKCPLRTSSVSNSI